VAAVVAAGRQLPPPPRGDRVPRDAQRITKDLRVRMKEAAAQLNIPPELLATRDLYAGWAAAIASGRAPEVGGWRRDICAPVLADYQEQDASR
jgi:ribonuclease D